MDRNVRPAIQLIPIALNPTRYRVEAIAHNNLPTNHFESINKYQVIILSTFIQKHYLSLLKKYKQRTTFLILVIGM